MFSVFDRVASLRRILAGGVAVCALAAALIPAGSAAQPTNGIPQLMSREYGWSVSSWDFLIDAPPGAGHGPSRPIPPIPT